MIIFSYLCRMMENIDTKQNNNYSLLICFLDLMIINSCGIFLACIAGAQTLVFSVFAGINAIAIVILREWLMRILNIHVNVSWLNVLLKRIISLAVGITISVTNCNSHSLYHDKTPQCRSCTDFSKTAKQKRA